MNADRDSFAPASLSTCVITSLESVMEVFSLILPIYYHRHTLASEPRTFRFVCSPTIDYCSAALLHFASFRMHLCFGGLSP